MLLQDLKLTKQLINSFQEEGIESATEIQGKGMSRIIGGQDLVLVGPEGCGKSTLIVMSVLSKLNHAFEDAPRALILVPNVEAVESLVNEFERFIGRSDLRIEGIHAKGNISTQKDDLFNGVDVVVGTPDRVYSLLLKYGLNLNQLKMFVLDDAEDLVKQGFHVQIRGLADSLPKCQSIVSTTVYHNKLQRLMGEYLNYPNLLEVFPKQETQVEYITPSLYVLPNFKTKQNLLDHILNKENQFSKLVIFANTRLTVGNLYTRIQKLVEEGEVGILHALLSTQYNYDSVDDFIEDEESRILLVAHETHPDVALGKIEQVIVFDFPEMVSSISKRLVKSESSKEAYFFATDLELAQVAKIEAEIGEKLSPIDLPDDLIIEGKSSKKVQSVVQEDPTQGGAFHKKKEKNAKDQPNFNTYDKRKMYGKARKKGRG